MTADGIICRIKELAASAEALKTAGKKGGRLRLCIDPKELSKNIKTKHFHLLTSNNMCARRAGAKFLSRCVALAGRWQILLDTKSWRFCLLIKLLGRCCCVGCLLECVDYSRWFCWHCPGTESLWLLYHH